MKSLTRSVLVMLLVFIMSFTISCDILTPIDPELKDQHEAYYTIVEAHALKQVWIYHFFQTFSNNYQRGQLFIYEPNSLQLESLMNEFAELMTYADAVEAAVDTLEALQNDPASASFGKPALPSGLISSMYDFFTTGSQVGKNNRDRILLIASNMTQTDRDALYNKLGGEFNGQFSNSDDFWIRLQNGELDKVASNIYRDFYDEDGGINNSFGDLARDKNLTPGKIIVKDGSMLIEKGGTVIVEVVKTVVPALGAGIDAAETGKKWYEKGKKMVDKPLEFVTDEIKSRAAAKIAGMVDVDGPVDHVAVSDGLANTAKVLMDVSIGTSDSQELVEKGIDWGMAKLSSSDKSITPDVIVAENNDPTGFPEFIFGVGNYVNQIGETLITLPQGNWDITARTARGTTNTPVNTTITAQQETSVDVVVSPGGAQPDSLDLEDMDFSKLLLFDMTIQLGGYMFNIPYYNYTTQDHQLSWIKNAFTLASFDDTSATNYKSFETSISGNVSLISYDQIGLYGQIEHTVISYNYGAKSYMDEISIDLGGLPINPSTFDTSGTYIGFAFQVPEGNNVEDYISFSFIRTDYFTNGENKGGIDTVIVQNTFDYSADHSLPAIDVRLHNYVY